ncbi:MAG: GNAT family N-acetyltransferase [Salinirussus sp.]
MEIEAPDTTVAGDVIDLWVDLAESQRSYGSHLLADENRGTIRESVVRHIVTESLLVARDGDDLVGFVMFGVESGSFEQDVRRGLVENLFVAEPYRRETVGGRLLDAAEARLAEQDVEVIALEVMSENEEARAFYDDHEYDPHRIELEKVIDRNSKADEED